MHHKLSVKKLIAVIFTILFLSIGILPQQVHAAETGNDISSKVDFGKNKLEVLKGSDEWVTIYENGNSLPGAPDIYTGNQIRFTFTWSISDLIGKGIKPGDYFEIKLPTEMLSFVSTESKPLVDSNNTTIGEFKIDKSTGKVIVKLNDEIAGRLDIKNGKFNAIGRADKKTSEDTFINIVGEKIPFKVKQSSIHWYDVGEINKSGWQEGTSNEVYWSIFVNQTNFKKVYEEKEFETLRNVVLVDKIEKNMQLDRYTINAPLMLSSTGGELTWKSFSNADITNQFSEIDQNVDESLDSYVSRIRSNNIPSKGVYTDPISGDKHIVVGFKDLKSSQLTNVGIDEALARLENFKNSNSEYFQNDEYAQTIKDIHKVYELTDGKGVILPSVSVWSKVKGGNQTLSNEAEITYNDTEKKTSTSTIKYIDYTGGADMVDPQSIVIQKFDEELSTPLAGVGFELQMKQSDGTYLKYKEEKFTDNLGKVEFDSLPYGSFRIVESSPLPGYKKNVKFVDIESNIFFDVFDFTITGTETKGIFLSAYNEKESVINISGTKTWVDGDNQDGMRPDKIVVRLMNGTEEVARKEVSAADNWSYSFTNLAEYADGTKMEYTIEEEAVAGYETQINGYDITNTHQPSTTSVSGTKTWVDGDNQDGMRPDKIVVRLMNGTEEVARKEVSAADNWSYSFTNLAEYADGTKIEYTIEEEAVAGYETEINGYDITNTHQPKTISVSGTKTWVDGDNQDGMRPDKIIVRLMNGTEEVARKEVSAADNWSYSFTNLAEYADGTKIEYTIEEEAVAGYETQVNGYDITNTHTPKDPIKPVVPTLPNTGINKLGIIYGSLLAGLGLIVLRKKES